MYGQNKKSFEMDVERILHNRGHICDNNPIYYGNTVCEYDEQL